MSVTREVADRPGGSTAAQTRPSAGAPALQAHPEVPRGRRRRRRWIGLLAAVALPCALGAVYLWGFAADQFVSEYRFAVHRQIPSAAAAPEGGGGVAAALLGGGNPALALTQDAQVVVQYLRSRQAMEDAERELDLAAIFGRAGQDFWARLAPGEPAEDRLLHWRRFVRPRFELTSGVVIVEVWAFDAADALSLAQVSLAAAERLVNGLSARSRADAVAFAREAAARTSAGLAAARDRLAEFRNANGLLSPMLAAGSGSSQESQIRGQISEARAQLQVMQASYANRNAAPLRLQAERVAALEAELRDLLARMAAPLDPREALTLATLAGGHTALEADERIAQAAHERALAALSLAESQAVQQSAYLDAFVRPAAAERASYPQRWWQLLEIAGSALAAWAIGALLLQAIRDQAE